MAQAYLNGDSVEVEGHVVTGAKDPQDLDAIRRFAVAYLRREQNLDLAAFGVSFDRYFLESSLYADHKVEETVRKLVASGHTYEEGGALWLKHHRLRRRQGPRDAQVRRHLHVLRAGRGVSPQQMAARLRARESPNSAPTTTVRWRG